MEMNMLKDEFDSYGVETKMSVNDLCCIFNMPQALKSQINEGKEVSQGLPPHAPRKAFKVDEYDCPTSWMHGSSLANSYFVPVVSERGMWLDFNQNAGHRHHLAILISVQGLNPLDGQSLVDGAMHLRQYKHKCPVHDVEFGADRFCEKCGYKWVPQNYLATTGTPTGLLWLDGFLASDGVVRQYYFTEEEAKGVAHQVLGAEKKVYSIGIAFYLSKEPKPVVKYDSYRGGSSVYSMNACFGGLESMQDCEPAALSMSVSKNASKQHTNSNVTRSLKRTKLGATASVDSESSFEDFIDTTQKMLEIGAGAKIDQKVYADPNDIDFWQDKPAGVLYINYCSVEQATSILKKGQKDRTKKGEGFLAGLNTGK